MHVYILTFFSVLPASLLSGRLAVYDCVRVPKKFHARSSATWRRYLYLFPLNTGEFSGFDIDIEFVNNALKRYVYILCIIMNSYVRLCR